MSHEQSGGDHLGWEEVGRYFLRVSLEKTLASNRLRSVRAEEGVGVVGSCHIWFLMFFFRFSFVFLLPYTLIGFYYSFVAG